MQINKKDLKPTTYHWYDLNFYLTDHLGNNRVVAGAGGTVEQVTHYYPYGGLTGESTGGSVQPYKYNGKELERMNGLDLYDYGARWMDSKIDARFTTMDPMCEKYYDISPYAYCAGNPVNLVDPDGRVVIIHYLNQDGKYVYQKYFGIWHINEILSIRWRRMCILAIQKRIVANQWWKAISCNKIGA